MIGHDWGGGIFGNVESDYDEREPIHLIASESFTLPRYLCVVDKSACRRITLLTISIGVPDLDA
jgi:hypothetical protein